MVEDRGYHFLVVDDDHLVRRSLRRFFELRGEVTALASGRSALEVLMDASSRKWSGAVIDWKLPDADGLDIVRRIRAHWPALPVLLLTGEVDIVCINEVHAIGAEYAAKPVRAVNLLAFYERVVATQEHDPVAGAIVAFVADNGLTPGEGELVRLLCRGVARDELAGRLRVKESTVKTLIRRLLKKADAPTTHVLVRDILYAATRSPALR